MDVEGFEFYLLPHLIGHGALCGIDQILLEVHPGYVPDAPQHFLENLNWTLGNIKDCRTKVVELTDESYVAGSDTTPLPPPVFALNTSLSNFSSVPKYMKMLV